MHSLEEVFYSYWFLVACRKQDWQKGQLCDTLRKGRPTRALEHCIGVLILLSYSVNRRSFWWHSFHESNINIPGLHVHLHSFLGRWSHLASLYSQWPSFFAVIWLSLYSGGTGVRHRDPGSAWVGKPFLWGTHGDIDAWSMIHSSPAPETHLVVFFYSFNQTRVLPRVSSFLPFCPPVPMQAWYKLQGSQKVLLLLLSEALYRSMEYFELGEQPRTCYSWCSF